MKDPTVKTCITCKHHEGVFDTSTMHYCVRDVPAHEFSPVTGSGWTSTLAKSCFVRRVRAEDACGPGGKCYEPIY